MKVRVMGESEGEGDNGEREWEREGIEMSGGDR